MVNQTVGRVHRVGQLCQFEYFRRSAPEDQVGVENDVFLLDPSNDVDVSIGDDDGLGVIWQVVQSVELLDLVVLAFEIEEEAVRLLDGEDWDFFDIFLEVGGLSNRNSSFISLRGPCEIKCRYSIAQNL